MSQIFPARLCAFPQTAARQELRFSSWLPDREPKMRDLVCTKTDLNSVWRLNYWSGWPTLPETACPCGQCSSLSPIAAGDFILNIWNVHCYSSSEPLVKLRLSHQRLNVCVTQALLNNTPFVCYSRVWNNHCHVWMIYGAWHQICHFNHKPQWLLKHVRV